MQKVRIDMETTLIGSADIGIDGVLHELNCYSGDRILAAMVAQGLEPEEALDVIVEIAKKGDLVVVWGVIKDDSLAVLLEAPGSVH